MSVFNFRTGLAGIDPTLKETIMIIKIHDEVEELRSENERLRVANEDLRETNEKLKKIAEEYETWRDCAGVK